MSTLTALPHAPDLAATLEDGNLVLCWTEQVTERDLIDCGVRTYHKVRQLVLDEAQQERLRGLLAPHAPAVSELSGKGKRRGE